MNIKFASDKKPWGYIFTKKNDKKTIYLIEDLSFLREHIKIHGLASYLSSFPSLDISIEANIESDISHETTHNVLNRIEGFKTSLAFDKIDKKREITIQSCT